MGNRTSEKKTPLFGDDYVQHYDSDGNKSGRSERDGDHVQHYDSYGRKTGTSKVNALGETEHFDKYGRKTGYSKEDALGNVQHYDKLGRRTGTSTKNFWNDTYTHTEYPTGDYTEETPGGVKIHHYDSILHPVFIETSSPGRGAQPEYARFGDRLSGGIAYVQGITLLMALLMLFIPGHYLLTAAHFTARQSLLVFALTGLLLSLCPFLHRAKLAKKKEDTALRKTGQGFLVIHLVFTMATAVIALPRLYGYLMLSFTAYHPISHIFSALPIWAALVVYGLFLGIATNVAMKQHSEHRSTIVDLSRFCNGCYSLLLSLPFSFMLFLQDAENGFGSRLLDAVVGSVILLLLYKVITVVGNFIYALTIRYR